MVPAVRAELVNPRLLAVPRYMQVRLEAARERALASGRKLYDLGVGDPREPTPPFIRRALSDAVPESSRYPSAFGSAELRGAIAAYLSRVFGVTCDPERELIVSSGSKEAIFHLPLALLDPGAERRGVLYGDPGYPIYQAGALLAGGEPLPVPLTAASGFRLEPETIPAGAASRARMLWISYPHNPTGTVVDRDYLARMLAFAREHALVLCADECYVELAGPRRGPSVLELGREGVLAFHSLSKRSAMTGYRSGFVAGDAELIAAFRRLRPLQGAGSPEFVQRAAAAAWADDAHVEERRRVFEAKRRVFGEMLASAGAAVTGEGALYLWVETPRGETAEAHAERLAEAGLLLAPGTLFGAGEGYVRAALAPPLEECREAAELWRSLL